MSVNLKILLVCWLISVAAFFPTKLKAAYGRIGGNIVRFLCFFCLLGSCYITFRVLTGAATCHW